MGVVVAVVLSLPFWAALWAVLRFLVTVAVLAFSFILWTDTAAAGVLS